ncbi:hypothetical protein C8F04DRAFT_1194974 [Mycena alexandri]|uniref:Bacteriophage T5 Orf172 DNA-binding domain-containing protein n=1 Tax=Mycena alexandri TaxID=1745969 RepID=A0AAD6S816_9AGAR|nr:hypothetical protein C8F04DRAFT_1194974 [Mycena alexandri]
MLLRPIERSEVNYLAAEEALQALKRLLSLSLTANSSIMAPIRVNPKLATFVQAYNTNTHWIIPALPNTYTNDGGGYNYLLRRRLRSDVDDFHDGLITPAQLEARTEYKWGQTGRDIGERRREYRKCLQLYEIEWIASYTTPARKLTEALVHDEFRVDGFQVEFTDCSCGHRHREWFSLAPTGGNTGAALEYVFGRWMALLNNWNWRKEDL